MANMKVIDADQLDADLSQVADAIREMSGSEGSLAFPSGFTTAIRELSGGTEEGENLADLLITGELTSYSSDVAGIMADNAFQRLTKLVSISLPNIVSVGAEAFRDCSSLTQVNLPAAQRIPAYAFGSCTSLRRLVLPASHRFGPYSCTYCTNLEYVDLGEASTVYADSFQNCPALTTLILRNTKGCNGGSSGAFLESAISEGSGYIYVPASLMEYYQTTTPWSDFASQLRAIEDYPEICGGESDGQLSV